MSWDVELQIPAPIDEVYRVLAEWHRHKELLSLNSVLDYRVLACDGRSEYFQLKVRDLPIKASYCYGKRLMRRPDIIVTMYVYRFFRSKTLTSPVAVDKLLRTRLDSFFYHTAKLTDLDSNLTLLEVNEPGGESLSGQTLEKIRSFYIKIGSIACGGEVFAEDSRPTDDGRAAGHGPLTDLGDEDYNPYAILGVSREDHFDSIKRAYRKMVLRWHPDRHISAGPVAKEYAHNRFIEITAAYHSILRSQGL